jgi:uncharacterized membrane protein
MPLMDKTSLHEFGAVALSLAVLGAYHLFVRFRMRSDPDFRIQGVLNRAREAWVERMIREDLGILAVQTLRNSIMAATFFATTAVALVVGTITLSMQSGALRRMSESLAESDERWWFLKVVILLVDMLGAFFFFAQAIRYLMHVSLMIAAPSEAASPTMVSKLLIQAGRFHTRGMRCYYYAGPVLLWLFGPAYLVLATCALVVALYFLDRTPE